MSQRETEKMMQTAVKHLPPTAISVAWGRPGSFCSGREEFPPVCKGDGCGRVMDPLPGEPGSWRCFHLMGTISLQDFE